MEGRRTSGRSRLRSSPVGTKTPTQKSPSRRSPGRKSPVKPSTPTRKSPSRKASPGRRASPGRKKSPARKSPLRKSSPKRGRPRSVNVNTTARPATPAQESIKEKIEEKLSGSPAKARGILNASPEKKDLKASSSVHSVHTAYSSSTVTTTATVETVDIGTTKPEDTSGDSEIATLTSLAAFVRRSVSVAKNLTPTHSTHHLTPTPTTEQSRHSVSRSVSRSVYEDDYSKTEYSDNEHEEHFESFQTELAKNSYASKAKFSRQTPAPREFGAIFVSLLLLFIPAITYYLQWTCKKKNNCQFQKIELTLPNREILDEIFTREKLGAYFALTSAIFTLSAFPLGRVVKLFSDRGTLEYYFNSLAVSLLATLAFGIAEYLGYSVADFILENYLPFYIFNVLCAFTLSFWCYLRSRFVNQNLWNPYAKSGIAPLDFAIGREVNPKWFNIIDIKLVCYRTLLVATLLFAETFIYKNLQITKLVSESVESQGNNGTPVSYVTTVKDLYNNTSFDPTSLLTSVLLLIYILDSIYYEHHLATSFELQQEGVGALLLLRYAITPFLLSAIPKYFFENQGVILPWWTIALIITIFMIGLILKRKSNSIKYRYRLNPHRMDLAYVDTVPTFQGKRLLLGPLWGRLRQPNYTGDILSLISFTIPLYWKFAWPPLICSSLIILNLFHRAVRVNKRNFARYNSAWARYCSRVRYLIIPKVF